MLLVNLVHFLVLFGTFDSQALDSGFFPHVADGRAVIYRQNDLGWRDRVEHRAFGFEVGTVVAIPPHEQSFVGNAIRLQPSLSACAIASRASCDDEDGVAGGEVFDLFDHVGNWGVAVHPFEECLPVFTTGPLDMMKAMPDVGDCAVDINQDVRFGSGGSHIWAAVLNPFDACFTPRDESAAVLVTSYNGDPTVTTVTAQLLQKADDLAFAREATGFVPYNH